MRTRIAAIRPVLPLRWIALAITLLGGVAPGSKAHAEDGYDLWLRYRPVEPGRADAYRRRSRQVVAPADTPTQRVARSELLRGLAGLLGAPSTPPPIAATMTEDGALVLGTPRSSSLIAGLPPALLRVESDGHVLRSLTMGGHQVTVIAARTDLGVLYGVFHFLRLLQTRASVDGLNLADSPRVRYRVLDHWDNLNGSVERGYAGASLWDWHKLPDYLDPRYVDYARANASLGINGSVLTNVNADALSLTAPYLGKAAALAEVFRPYGIRVYLTARFSAPIEIGGLKTADPLDPAVKGWWKVKVDEIYRHIPDFGGFLVKANSEGQPGPQDYGRSHADGANLLADALAPHGGVVMWRAFVYSSQSSQAPEDRAKQAYAEFVPLDGAFHDNVLLQVKNGPIDFQPREPFHPLFGAMPRTPLVIEVQLTKEYLGFATHLAYLGPLFAEALASDTQRRGKGSTVARVIDGSLHGHARGGMAGVSNIGTDRNWTGSHFDQANWYAFGRLAWNPTAAARDIAEEWVRMTFSNDGGFVRPAVDLMMASREAVVDYMTPLGLHHLMARGHHYGPGPWVAGGPRADWTAVYYHRADREGIGFDRTATGSNAVAQYAPAVARELADPGRCPEELLLWFHHLSWDHPLRSRRTLWDELAHRYTRGAQWVGAARQVWGQLSRFIDAERADQIGAFLAIQEKEAWWWRDASLAYFQTLAGRPLPAGTAAPAHPLEYYQAIEFRYVPGH